MPVNSKHPEYSTKIKQWTTCQDFYDGEDAVKAQGVNYLPKPLKATESEYQNYVQRAFFFAAIERTLSGLVGIVTRKAPTYEIPPSLEYLKENVDNNDNSLISFSESVLHQALLKGRYGILIDAPSEGGTPYLVLYHAEDIINWHTENNELQWVVLRERYYNHSSDDPFAQMERTRYRVLYLDEGKYTQQVYNEILNKDAKVDYQVEEAIQPKRAGISFDFIPFIIANAKSISAQVEKPPMLDLVHKNAECYRVGADYANTLHFVGNPIIYTTGVTSAEHVETSENINGELVQSMRKSINIVLGSSRAVNLPNNATIQMLECSGHGVNPARQKYEDCKAEMAVLGARLLEPQRSGVEAAETAKIRQAGETSTLSSAVTTCGVAIKKALQYVDVWMGGSGDGIEFALNKDLTSVQIDPALLTSLADMVQKGLISWDTFFFNLASGELVPQGRTKEEEEELIENSEMGKPVTNILGGYVQDMGNVQDGTQLNIDNDSESM